MVDKIQAKYDQLASAASNFAQQADQTTNLVNSAKQCVQRLQGGHWIGQGAQNFFKEMQDLVFPGMNRLVNSLQDARTATQRIVQVFQQAEQEAANLFRDGNEIALPYPGVPPQLDTMRYGAPEGVSNDFFDNRRRYFTISTATLAPMHNFTSGRVDAVKYQVTVDGRTIDVFYPAVPEGRNGHFHSPQQVAQALAALPKASRDLVVQVNIEPYKNPADPYWAQQYNMPGFESYMTAGGNGIINMYPTTTQRDLGHMTAVMIHETGHILSERMWGPPPPNGNSQGWQNWAQLGARDGIPVSQYGNSSVSEDFSESLAQYMLYTGTSLEGRARQLWPNRFAEIDRILQNR